MARLASQGSPPGAPDPADAAGGRAMREAEGAPLVLVVEDEPLQRMMAVDMAEAAGFAVLEAADAEAAVRLLSLRPDVRIVLTDIDMPGPMDGVHLAAAIRARWPAVEVILISGRRVPDPAALPPRVAFFPKPYRPREVIAVMRRLLS
jgi:CheY-like chemotaxis protein